MNKRTFLKQSGSTAIVSTALGTALGTALSGIGTAIAAENATGTRSSSNRGIIYKAVKTNGKLTAEQLAKLNELGFDGVEGVSPGIADKAAYMDMIRASGMPVHGVVDMVHWQQRLSSPDAATRAAGQQALAQAVTDAKEFGASSVLLVPGKVTGPNETHDHVWQRSLAEIRKTIPLASKLGIHILIENVWNGFCETPELLCDYIDEINSPWFGVYFDIGNVQKFAPAHECIRKLGKRIVKLDVKDWGAKTGFCKLGEGDVNWPEVRMALKEVGFCGWATREGNDGGHEHTARLMNELLDL